MFRVECAACRAPYQVDERRVPASGLKMRCPKCGSSFQVLPPSADPRAPSPVLSPPRGTAMGPGAGDVPKPPLPKKKLHRGTMIGVAPAQGSKKIEIDLPSVGTPPAPAAPKVDLDLPARAGPDETSFGEIDLPIAASAGTLGLGDSSDALPDLAVPRSKPPGATAGELDLPLAAPRGKAPPPGAGELDLPLAAPPSLPAMPRVAPASLPAPLARPASLPAPKAAPPSLSAPKGPMDDLGFDLPGMALEMDLPSPGQGVGLPSPSDRAGLPASLRGSDLPASLGGSGLPARPAPVFGEIDLPSASDLPSLGTGGGNLPDTPGDPFGEMGRASPSGPPRGEEVDFGAPGRSSAPPEVRGAGGSAGYGEVRLEESAGGAFGVEDVASAAESSELELPQETGAPASLPAGAPKKERERPAPGTAAVRSRRRLWFGIGTVAVLAIGGAALSVVPAAGPFGAHFVVDMIRRGDHEKLLVAKTATAQKELGEDTYPEAARAIAEVQAAARSAVRYKPLAGYAAYTGFARVLRFGTEAQPYAQAKVALDELAEAKGVREVDLARATRAAVDGELAQARAALTALASAAPRDVDVAVSRGEVELRARDVAAATAAWSTAVSVEKSARTMFGLARAAVLSGDMPKAEALAGAVLAASPAHAGARLLIAEAAWSIRHDEALAMKLLGEVLQAEDRIGPEERILARTVLGEIHLDRGRMTQAEEAFGEAIRVAEAIKLGARAARALTGLGETLFRAGRYSQGIARFRAALQADPDAVSAAVGVAKSSLLLERVDEAKDILNKLRKSYPKDPRVAYWAGRVLEVTGDRKQAEATYRESIELGHGAPESVDAYIALATALSADGDADAANASLADAQAKLPASPALFKALGRVAMAQGRYADALTEFHRALELDGGDAEGRFLSGSALVRLREFDKALAAFDAVAKADKDFPGLALERGILYQESGRTEEALREYETALSKAPTDPDLLLRVGCAKGAAGGGDAAEQMLHKVLEQRPNSAEPHFCLGQALMARNDLSDALKELERAVQIDPNRAEYHLYVGWVCNESGALAKAGTALKRALELDQGLADAYWQRGVLRLRQTRPKDAVEDLTKALTLRPSRAEPHADLALAYYDLGKEDLALGEWQKAIEMKPGEAAWHFHYGKLLNLRLKNPAAAEQLEKAIALVPADAPPPTWLSEAHRIAAVSLGTSRAAVPHWQAFLKLGPPNSPYRAEAKAALRRLGAPIED